MQLRQFHKFLVLLKKGVLHVIFTVWCLSVVSAVMYIGKLLALPW